MRTRFPASTSASTSGTRSRRGRPRREDRQPSGQPLPAARELRAHHVPSEAPPSGASLVLHPLDRLELLERLPAAAAVPQRAARRRAEEVLELRVRRAAVRAAEGARLELDELRPARLSRRRRREARGAQLLASLGRDAVCRPRVVRDHRHLRLAAELAHLAAIWSRMTSSAGQPRNVGVNSTRTRPSSTATSRTTPSSTSEITGISGSGSLRARPRPALGHHVAPATERRTIVISSQSALNSSLGRPRSPSRGRSSSSASAKRGSPARRCCHICAWSRW